MDNLLNQLKQNYQSIEESTSPAFCYMLGFSGSDLTRLKKLQNDLDLDGEKTKKDDFHITVRYVRTPRFDDYKFFVAYLEHQKELPAMYCKTVGFDILGKDKDCLVLKIESPDLTKYFEKVNKWLVDNGYPKSDYSTYKPHITLSEKKDITKPKWDSKYEMSLRLCTHIVSDTNRRKVFKKEL